MNEQIDGLMRQTPDKILLTERKLTGAPGWVFKIGGDSTPPFLVLDNDQNLGDGELYIFSPTGFCSYTERKKFPSILTTSSEISIGRQDGIVPIPKNGGNKDSEDLYISNRHMRIKPIKGGIDVIDQSRNGTFCRPIEGIEESILGKLLNKEAIFADPRVSSLCLKLGNAKVKLTRDGQKVRVEMNDVLLDHLVIGKKPDFITLGRTTKNEDLTISRNHCSLILMPDGNLYIFDHSTNGTRVVSYESIDASIMETDGCQPKVIKKNVRHKEQQIDGDSHSVGGDYYLFGEDVVKNPELIEKGGNAVVLMDTATLAKGWDSRNTREFARVFLKNYYEKINAGLDPEKAAKDAYDTTYYNYKGDKAHATFTFVTVVNGLAYSLWIGNTEAVVVRDNRIVRKLASSEGMVGEVYTDQSGQKISPTILVAAGIDQIRTNSFQLLPGDRIYVFTDGVAKLDINDPKSSILENDDVVLVKIN